jgi:hypothetical protein
MVLLSPLTSPKLAKENTMKCPIALSITTLALLSSLTACSTTAPRLSDTEYAQRLAIFRDNAGEPGSVIPQRSYSGYRTKWTLLGDATIAMWRSPEEGYLIEFTQPCSSIKHLNPNYDAIGFTQGSKAQISEGDTIDIIYNKLDRICRIQTIPPRDEKSLAEQMQTLPRQDGLFEFEPVRGLIANND